MDSLDLDIVNRLKTDARIAFADIAKELNVSPGIVQARYNRMKTTGVIKGTTLILDLAKMGTAFSTSIGIEVIESDLEEVNNYVRGLKIEEAQIFSWITFGRYNIATAIFSKNLLQAHKIMQLIKQHPSVIAVSISLSDMNQNECNQSIYDNSSMPNPIRNIPMKLDNTDVEIIRILCKDARTPFKRIGNMLGIGTETVFRRYRRLQKKGVISGSTVVLSSKAFDIMGLCGFFVKLKTGSSLSVIKDKIDTGDKYIFVMPKWGEYDFYIDFYFKDLKDIFDMFARFRSIKEIVAVDPMIYVLQEWSMPYLLQFEAELPVWAFAAEN